MTPPALSPTADAFAVITAPVWDKRIVSNSWTWVTKLGLPDEVSDTLETWGSSLVTPQVAVAAFPETEVEAIDYMMKTLDVPLHVVLKAVSVPKRTFHGWKSKGHRPRDAAKDAIWAMTETVATLAAVHHNVGKWFRANPDIQKAFKSGDVNQLALADLEWANSNSTVVRPFVPDDAADFDMPYAQPTAAGLISEDVEDSTFTRHTDQS